MENSERDGKPDHLTCLFRNLYAGQEATVRTGHGTTDWFQLGKEVRQGCILSPCLFNFYAEYIMRNAGSGYRTPQPLPLPSAAVATVATVRARGQSRTPPLVPEAQAGIKIAGRNINNLRYADDTTLMAESL